MVVIKTSIPELLEVYHKNEDSGLMKDILFALECYSEQWEDLIYDLKVFNPKCDELGYCPEKHGCGRKPTKKETNG